MQLRPLKAAVHMCLINVYTTTNEGRLNMRLHRLSTCCDQPSATLFPGAQTVSGGVAGKEDSLPVYCLHQMMTSPHEV